MSTRASLTGGALALGLLLAGTGGAAFAQNDADSDTYSPRVETPRAEPRDEPETKPREQPKSTETATPRATPKTESSGPASIKGIWAYTANCSNGTFVGALTFASASASGISGRFRGESSDTDGAIGGGGQNGSSVSFVVTYKDYLGSTTRETYAARLDASGRSMSGSISGGWASGCSFTARRG